MIRADKFLISKRLYAVDLSSLRVAVDAPLTPGDQRSHWVDVDAVWFRRRRGVTVACVGFLRDYQGGTAPADAEAAVAHMDDGRYGGRCEGRWDGTRYWGAQHPDEIVRHLELLRPMLANYPAIPAPYSGWFQY